MFDAIAVDLHVLAPCLLARPLTKYRLLVLEFISRFLLLKQVSVARFRCWIVPQLRSRQLYMRYACRFPSLG